MAGWSVDGGKWRLALFGTALAGLVVSGYLLQAYVSTGPVVCGSDTGCETVRLSKYASWFGIPTPAYGVAYFGAVAAAAVMMPAAWRRGKVPLMVLTAGGISVSAGLTYIEAFVIEAWCRWCIASAVAALLTFILTWVIIPRYDE